MIKIFKTIIVSMSLIVVSNPIACFADEIDTSKWTYDDLTPVALQAAAQKDYERALKF